MNKRTDISKWASFILIGLLVVFFFSTFFQRNRLQWFENYSEQSKDPYATYLLGQVLKAYYPGHQFIRLSDPKDWKLPANGTGHCNYFFIGRTYFTSEAHTDSLLQFIARGNTALIAANKFPYRLWMHLFQGERFCKENDLEGLDKFLGTTVRANLRHPDVRLPEPLPLLYRNQTDSSIYVWKYFPDDYFCPGGLTAAGHINDLFVNFAFASYGKGKIFFLSTPIALTNIFLRTPEGKDYLDGIMAHLPPGDIYFDAASRIPILHQTTNNRRHRTQKVSQGPLAYILSQPALKAAWYTLVLMGILLLVFGTRRTQRTIPITPRIQNTSLIFIRNIADIYYQKRDYRNLALKKSEHFKDFIRNHYRIPFNPKDPDFITNLSERSGVPSQRIQRILALIQAAEKTPGKSFHDNSLIKLSQQINYFYEKAGKHG